MRRALAIFALCAAAHLPRAYAAPELLAPPRYLDPTRMCAYSCSNVLDAATAYFADGQASNFTAICWMKWTPRANIPDGGSGIVPFVNASVSADPARATGEGGDELPDLQLHRYEVPLALDNGTWGETCLPSYAYPANLPSWQYGCYCVNIETDTALTLNVAGGERSISASAEKQIFNIMGETASRAVSVSAASTSATVKFGIAENPLVQVIGAQFDDSEGFVSQFTGGTYGGIVSNEWRMIVVRGAIITNAVTMNVCGYNATSKIPCDRTTVQALWHPRATFAKNARLRYVIASLASMQKDGYFDVVHVYGFRVFRGWFDTATIERMRDLDVAEIQRRGM